jgi:hypothetical protein
MATHPLLKCSLEIERDLTTTTGLVLRNVPGLQIPPVLPLHNLCLHIYSHPQHLLKCPTSCVHNRSLTIYSQLEARCHLPLHRRQLHKLKLSFCAKSILCICRALVNGSARYPKPEVTCFVHPIGYLQPVLTYFASSNVIQRFRSYTNFSTSTLASGKLADEEVPFAAAICSSPVSRRLLIECC